MNKCLDQLQFDSVPAVTATQMFPVGMLTTISLQRCSYAYVKSELIYFDWFCPPSPSLSPRHHCLWYATQLRHAHVGRCCDWQCRGSGSHFDSSFGERTFIRRCGEEQRGWYEDSPGNSVVVVRRPPSKRRHIHIHIWTDVSCIWVEVFKAANIFLGVFSLL